MRKLGLLLMLAVMLATPMLACGFPLTAGTDTLRVTKAACATGEPLDSCQMRQDAYQLMSKLQSAVIPDFEVQMISGVPDSEGSMQASGWMAYEASESDEGLGANLHVTLDSAIIDFGGADDDLTDMEAMIFGTEGYSSPDGINWTYETLNSDALLGLGLLLGLNGAFAAELDMYVNPDTFTVTQGETITYEGQEMIVQTLELDLSKLLLATDTLTELLTDGFAVGGDTMGVTAETLGMPVEEFATVAGMLLPFLEGTGVTTTLYIGADDGYIHYIEENYVMSLDMTAVDPEQAVMTASYLMRGHITQHNEALNLTPPENATPSEGGFLGDGLEGGLFN